MGLYLNGQEYQVLNLGQILNLEASPYHIITNGVKLFSSDDYLLIDSQGMYITGVQYIPITTIDNNILLDIENNYLTIRKE